MRSRERCIARGPGFNDPLTTTPYPRPMWRGFFILALVLPQIAWADLRVATWNAGWSRKGPGLLLRDILKGEVDTSVIAALDADVLLLTDVDYDMDLVALRALDLGYPHLFALRPNTGMATGLDMDGDGRLGGGRDAQGFGFFAGDGGMAVLSRYPIGEVRDFSGFLWRNLPGAKLPDMTAETLEIQRLSTTAHWDVAVDTPDGPLHLLAYHATPPAFEPRNILRNHDESAFWSALIDRRLPFPPPSGPFVVLGDANADPERGDSLPEGINMLLHHPRLQDPHDGPTASYESTGPLRVDYVLPSTDWHVLDAGVMAQPSGHSPVWVDIRPR